MKLKRLLTHAVIAFVLAMLSPLASADEPSPSRWVHMRPAGGPTLYATIHDDGAGQNGTITFGPCASLVFHAEQPGDIAHVTCDSTRIIDYGFNKDTGQGCYEPREVQYPGGFCSHTLTVSTSLPAAP